MTDLLLAQLPRTARGSLCAAFRSVGVTVHMPSVDDISSALASHPDPAYAVLRHPVDRLQSSFNLRIRAGRPHRPSTWSTTEAALFSVIHDFEQFGLSLRSHNPWLRSVGERLLMELARHSQLLPQMYHEASSPRLRVVGTTDSLASAVAAIASHIGCDVPALPTDPALIDPTPPSLGSAISPEARANLESEMADEIATYERLLATRVA